MVSDRDVWCQTVTCGVKQGRVVSDRDTYMDRKVKRGGREIERKE